MTRPPRVGDLTARELEVVDLVTLGLTNQQIAEELHLSPHTVKTHLRKIFERTGTANRTTLAAISRDRMRVRTSIEVAQMLRRLRDDRAVIPCRFGSVEYHRQEGELWVLDHLISQLVGIPERAVSR